MLLLLNVVLLVQNIQNGLMIVMLVVKLLFNVLVENVVKVVTHRHLLRMLNMDIFKLLEVMVRQEIVVLMFILIRQSLNVVVTMVVKFGLILIVK